MGDEEGEAVYDVENTVFVAVGKNVKEGKSTLYWAVKSFSRKRICLLHVHQPTQLLSAMDGKLSNTKLKQAAVKACQELERQKMHKLVNQYLVFLDQAGIQGDKMWLEMNDVEKGIVQVIREQNIRWLVMGAAAEKYYSKKLSGLKSNKAIFVCQHAPVSCHIWFICSGCLIYTRDLNVGSVLPSPSELSSPRRNGDTVTLDELAKDSDDENADNCQETSTSVKVMNELKSTTSMSVETKEKNSPSDLGNQCQAHMLQSWSPPQLEEKSNRETTDDRSKLEHAITDAENAKQRAFEESLRRWRAEEETMEAIREAEASEKVCAEEVKRRKEIEEMLALQTQELEKLKVQHNQLSEELQMIKEQEPALQDQIEQSSCAEKELEEKIIQAVELLISFKARRDALKMERDTAIRELNILKKLVKEDNVDFLGSRFFEFSFSDITEATKNFDPSLKIGEGNFGSVYKGILRHLKVAIKMLPSNGSISDSEFEYEAEALSRVRHPNLVTLIGYCSESRSVVYEYLDNGNLEYHLFSQARSRLLHWQYRIRIAIEICSALIFLHANSPCLVHGNLKPSNILLDAKFVSKISDLGIIRLISKSGNPFNCTTPSTMDNPEASIYVDPDFVKEGDQTAKSDVYAFGIVILQLLTARPASGIVRDVYCALESGNFTTVLDFSAGDWPIEQAEELAYLGVRCCQTIGSNRPDLVSEVWPMLEPMKYLCTLPPSDSNSSCLGSKTQKRIPSHFVCPIFQEVMEDPYIAADGFTYEADAIKGWLYSGHETSPMTNLTLDHCDLIPNYALYYAIQEWQQQP
ncbi:U-box domain-containing protein 32 isoform X2 [Ipomoea triloba]|uniref:U-box domain-containing protein 32 isoform X2 n=1 Tax=Ipomoea triloba TaxID=35885 RepID=UPI00125D7374|nr:U-box domain-containing protein 32 isoform X2 [Ipomoea triloba]